MKKPNTPYYNPYYNPYNQPYYSQAQAPAAPYSKQNNRTHLVTGIVAGAAIAYLMSNKKVQQSVTQTGAKAWSAVRGEVEELKEKLEDSQAELEYYRNLHKDAQ